MVSLPIINIIIITVISKNSIARISSLAYTHAPPPPCINHDERNHVINEKRESEAASSKESLEQCGKFLARPNGMGNLGRHLRRLSSPRIRFLRKSRQSKPDPTRLFHNLLVARTWRRRPNARAFRARTVEGRKCVPVEFVRRRHKDRGTRACMGRVWGEGEGEGRQASDISWGEVSIRLDREGRTIAGEFLIRRAGGGSRSWARVVNQRGCAGKLASNLPITDIVDELMAVSPPPVRSAGG